MDTRIPGWILTLAGIWLILIPFVTLQFQAVYWNNLLLGIIISMFGFGLLGRANWQAWTGFLVGLWLITATFIPVFLAGTGLEWNSMCVGGVSVAVGITALWKGRA